MNFDNEKMVVSINGQKASTVTQNIDPFSFQMPDEVASLLEMMKKETLNKSDVVKNDVTEVKGQSEVHNNIPFEVSDLINQITNANNKISISNTSPNLNKVINDAIEGTSLVRSRPEMLQAVLDNRNALEKIKEETDPLKKLVIYETGMALGIIVGKTERREAIEIMKNFSKFTVDENEHFYFYSDITVSIFFDDSNIVNELKFGNKYDGQTSKGLSIGDSVSMAIEIYGKPKMKSPKGAIWEKFAIFCEKDLVTSIRIQK